MSILGALITPWAGTTPTPIPAYEGDVNLITPGVVGFAVTFLIAVATVLLIVDMTRRVRKVRYRGEVREQIAIEQAEQAIADADADADADAGSRAAEPSATTGEEPPPART